MRQKIVAGNWKMNKDAAGSIDLVKELTANVFPSGVRVMIAPATVFLDRIAQATKGTGLEVASQNMNAADSGAYTGEVSAAMLQSIGINATLLGHSERRAYYTETNESLQIKLKQPWKPIWKLFYVLVKSWLIEKQTIILKL